MLAAIIRPDTERVAVIVEDDKATLVTIDKNGFVSQRVLIIEPREPVPLTVIEGSTLEVQIATYL